MDPRTLAVQCLPDPKPWPGYGLLGHATSEHQESTEVCHFLPCACRTNTTLVLGCCQFGCPWVGMQCIQTFQVLWPRSLIRYIYGLRKHRQTPGTWSSALRYMFIPVDSSKPPSVVGSCECLPVLSAPVNAWNDGKALARSAPRAVQIGLTSTIPDAIEIYVFLNKFS